MRYDIKNAIENGKVIFKNTFDTDRGKYLILIIKETFLEEFYLAKYKDGVLVYAEKLNNMKEIDI